MENELNEFLQKIDFLFLENKEAYYKLVALYTISKLNIKDINIAIELSQKIGFKQSVDQKLIDKLDEYIKGYMNELRKQNLL